MVNPQGCSQAITRCAFFLLTSLLLSAVANAEPSIALSKKSGPPTSRILVSGRGFEANVGVDIFFDTKNKALVVTNGKGEFHDAAINAPRSAHPGEHWVTALERNNDTGARAPFLVRTNWQQFQFDNDHSSVNPFENVISRMNVASLTQKWVYTSGEGLVFSTPTVANGIAYVTAIGLYAVDTKTGALLRLMSYVAVSTKVRMKASAPARFRCSVVAEIVVTNAPRIAVTVIPITTNEMRISTSVSPASGRANAA